MVNNRYITPPEVYIIYFCTNSLPLALEKRWLWALHRHQHCCLLWRKCRLPQCRMFCWCPCSLTCEESPSPMGSPVSATASSVPAALCNSTAESWQNMDTDQQNWPTYLGYCCHWHTFYPLWLVLFFFFLFSINYCGGGGGDCVHVCVHACVQACVCVNNVQSYLLLGMELPVVVVLLKSLSLWGFFSTCIHIYMYVSMGVFTFNFSHSMLSSIFMFTLYKYFIIISIHSSQHSFKCYAQVN